MDEHKKHCDISMILDLERDLLSETNNIRWEAASKLTDYAIQTPEEIWPLILRHGSSMDEDLRSAVATCILEHLLEYHFDAYFTRVEQEILSGNEMLKDTLKLCWKFGKAKESERCAKWESLIT